MYAVLLDRNKQYFVKDNSIVDIDFINVKVDSVLEFDKLLIFNDNNSLLIGAPYIESKIVRFKVISHFKDDKKIILKFRRRKHHMKRIGHRQKFTRIKVCFIGDK